MEAGLMSSNVSPASRRALFAALAASLAGCISDHTSVCGSVLCPIDTTCISELGCIDDSQVAACDRRADGAACSAPGIDGYCRFHACVARGCGDGVIDPPEQCEGANLGGASCTTLGYTNGALACHDDCTFDTSSCSGDCGDGVISSGEQCDGVDLAGQSCRSLGFYDDTSALKCTQICSFDVSGCTGYCGDAAINGPEDCDGPLPAGFACVDIGYDMGLPACEPNCHFDVNGCMRFGWHPVGVATVNPLNHVWMNSDRTAYAVGDRGVIVRSSGGSFIAQMSPTIENLFGVWGRNASDVYAVGAHGTVVHYDGTTWTSITTITDKNNDLRAVWGSDTVVYAVGGNGQIWQLPDGTLVHSSGSAVLTGIWGTSDHDVHVVGDGTYLHFDGTTWSSGPSPGSSVLDISGWADDDVFIATLAGVSHYENGVWTPISSSPTRGVVAVGPRTAIAVGDGGAITRLISDDWTASRTMVSGTTSDLSAIAAAQGRLVAVGTSGALRFDGADWHRIDLTDPTPPITSDIQYFDAWASDPEHLWMVGDQYITTSNGTTHVPTRVYHTLYSVSGIQLATGPFVISVGQNGAFFENTTQMTAPIGNTTLRDVRVLAGNPWLALAVGDSGTIVYADPSTITQVSAPALAGYELQAVWPVSATYDGTTLVGDVWVIGNKQGVGTVFHLDMTGQWTVMYPLASTLSDLWVGGSEVIAVATDGTLYDFDGATWTTVTTNVALSSISGSVDDLFVAGLTTLLHREGTQWLPVHVAVDETYYGLFAIRDTVVLTSFGSCQVLERLR
jgi:hypothetical protein